MIDNNKKTSTRISRQIPEFIREYYTNESGDNLFVLFIQAYYEWAEQTGQFDHLIRNSREMFDVDSVFFSNTFDSFKDYFFRQFLPGIPKNVLVNKQLLFKHGKEFYLNKGSDASFRFLFRVLYNDDISIFIPSTKVLTFSDPSRGIISGDCKIHDSFFWQQFSYEISSEITIQEYRDIITQLLHPAGMRMFGKFLTEIEVSLMTSAVIEMILFFQSEVSYFAQSLLSCEVSCTKIYEYSDFIGPTYSSFFNLIDNDPVAPPIILAYPSVTYSGSNTTTTVYCKTLGINFSDNSFIGSKFAIVDGTGVDQISTISAWDNQDNIIEITLSPALSVVPYTTSEFVIFKDTVSSIGSPQSATSSTIRLSANEIAVSDFYTGTHKIKIIYGPGQNEEFLISGYNGSTKNTSIDGVWLETPTTNSIYVIVKNDGNNPLYFEEYSNYPSIHYTELEIQELENQPSYKSNISEVEMFIYSTPGEVIPSESPWDESFSSDFGTGL